MTTIIAIALTLGGIIAAVLVCFAVLLVVVICEAKKEQG
jgi:cell division protein FtsN